MVRKATNPKLIHKWISLGVKVLAPCKSRGASVRLWWLKCCELHHWRIRHVCDTFMRHCFTLQRLLSAFCQLLWSLEVPLQVNQLCRLERSSTCARSKTLGRGELVQVEFRKHFYTALQKDGPLLVELGQALGVVKVERGVRFSAADPRVVLACAHGGRWAEPGKCEHFSLIL